MKIGDKEFIFKFEYKKPKLIWQIILAILAFFFISFFAIFAYSYIKFNKLVKNFSNASNLTKEEVLNTSSMALSQLQENYRNLENLDKEKTFLVLGTDKVTGRDGSPELTDTILLLRMDQENQKITTLSLPRDLYNDPYQTRINALYHYGLDRYPESPEQFPEEVLEEMMNIEIDHTIVVRIEDLQELIDILGGIEIEVPTAFTDPLFPRANVDVNKETDPEVLYEEITFEAGKQEMDGLRALQYMRSRHSEDDQGTDNARSQRQQLVLESLFAQIEEIRSAETLGKLYRFYLDNFEQYLSLSEIIELLTPYYDQVVMRELSLSFENQQLSVYPQNPEGLIYNPPQWQTNGEWLYKIRNQEKFLDYIGTIFNKD